MHAGDMELGRPVATADGHPLGTVAATQEHFFKVEAVAAPDFWLGGDLVRALEDGRYVLTLRADEVEAAKLRDEDMAPPHRSRFGFERVLHFLIGRG